jgi:acetolactate synthase-1/2/3 large subunit
MAKWAVEIDDVNRIPEILARAWVTALTGRPGPVVIALPEDMLTSLTDAAPLTGPTRVAEPAPDAATMAEVQAMLAGAKRPLILMGGCNWTEAGQGGACRSFAEASDIPVVAAFRYQDQFDNFSRCYAGEAGVGMPPHVKALIREADVILAVNVRFGEMTTDGYTLLSVPVPSQKLIHVHASTARSARSINRRLAFRPGRTPLPQRFARSKGGWAAWRAKARADWEAGFVLGPQPSPVDMGLVSAHLREVMPEDAILTNGAGNFTVWPNKFYKFGPKARLLAPQSGAMGYGVPAAVAAKVAFPDRVVCFAGDGDFQMNCQELGTAMQAARSRSS